MSRFPASGIETPSYWPVTGKVVSGKENPRKRWETRRCWDPVFVLLQSLGPQFITETPETTATRKNYLYLSEILVGSISTNIQHSKVYTTHPIVFSLTSFVG